MVGIQKVVIINGASPERNTITLPEMNNPEKEQRTKLKSREELLTLLVTKEGNKMRYVIVLTLLLLSSFAHAEKSIIVTQHVCLPLQEASDEIEKAGLKIKMAGRSEMFESTTALLYNEEVNGYVLILIREDKVCFIDAGYGKFSSGTGV